MTLILHKKHAIEKPAKGKGSLAHREDPGKQQAQLRRGLRATRLLDRDGEETRGRGNRASDNVASTPPTAPGRMGTQAQ